MIFVAAVAGAVYWTDPAGVAKSALAVNGLFLLVSLLVIVVRYQVRPLALLQAIARPCLAGGAMYALVVWLPVPGNWPAIADLLCRIALGGTIYPSLLALIWFLSGRPQSAEGKILMGVWSRFR